MLGAYILLNYSSSESPKNKIQNTPVIAEKKQVEQEFASMRTVENTIIEKIAEIGPSVVSIIIKKDLVIYRSDPFGFFEQPLGSVQRQVGWGTGFFVRDDGTIITNKHVISDTDAEYTVITSDGNEYDASVVATDPLSDIAIIKIDQDTPTPVLDFVESTTDIQVWQFAIAIWNALAEFQNSVSLGIVSGKERSIETGSQKLSGLIQTDTAINPGNSGWPLVDLDGKVIGINTAIINNSQGIGFSIAMTQARIDYILESIKKTGKIQRPFIGINYILSSPGIQEQLELQADYGAYVLDEAGSVIPGSSADIAGVEPGDIVLEIDGVPITVKNDLGSIIQNKVPGEILKLKVMKKSGQEQEIELKLGEL